MAVQQKILFSFATHGPTTQAWFANIITAGSGYSMPTGYPTSVYTGLIGLWPGEYSGTLEVQIRTVVGDLPTDTVLCSGSLEWTRTSTQAVSWTQFTVPISSQVALIAGTKYAIVTHWTINLPNTERDWFIILLGSVGSYSTLLESCNEGHSWHEYLDPDSGYGGLFPVDYVCGYPGVANAHQDLYMTAIPTSPSTPPDPLPDFPADRPDGYAPDDYWIPGEWNDDVYTPPEWSGPTPGRYFATGGGRWGQQLVVVGKSLIYYEELV